MAAVNITFPGNLSQVTSAADLRLIPTTLLKDGTLYLVSALAGIFGFDTGSVAADDGNSVIRPADRTPLQAGRWVKESEGLAPGPTGPADNTYTSYTALQASDPTRKSARLVGDTDTPARPDATYSNPTATIGGWVVQAADGITATRPGLTAANRRNLANKVADRFDLRDMLGFQRGGSNDQSPVINAAIAQAASEGVKLDIPPTNPGDPATWIKAGLSIRPVNNTAFAGAGQKMATFQRLPGGRGGLIHTAPGAEGFIADFGFEIVGNGEIGEAGIVYEGAAISGQSSGAKSYIDPHDIFIRDVRGPHFWFKGGTSNSPDCPVQFISMRRCRSIAGTMAEAIPLAITGKVGQLYADGACQFDGQEAGGPQLAGRPNIVISRQYTYMAGTSSARDGTAADALVLDYTNMANVVATPRTGWTLTPLAGGGVTDVAPYNINLSGATIQGRHDAVWVDRGLVLIDRKTRFEAIRRGITVMAGGIAIVADPEFQNGATLFSDPNSNDGYLGGALSDGRLFVRGEIVGGRADNAWRRLDSSGQVTRTAPGVFSTSYANGTAQPAEAIPSNMVPTLAPSGGVLNVGAYTQVRVQCLNPTTINTIISSHGVGTEITIEFFGDGITKFTPGGNLASAATRLGRPTRAREGDVVKVVRTDGFNFPYELQASIPELVRTGAPTSGYFELGERIWTDNPAPGGKVGNVCTTTGIAGSTAVFKPFGMIDA